MTDQPPVRMCCMRRHYGPICPDGKIMCCLCFDRVDASEAGVIDGERVDVCQPCAAKEAVVVPPVSS